jgi:hypothetical protein
MRLLQQTAHGMARHSAACHTGQIDGLNREARNIHNTDAHMVQLSLQSVAVQETPSHW